MSPHNLTRAFANIAFWTIILAGAVYAAAAKVYPAINNLQTAVIAGHSMYPTIPWGSLVYINPGQLPVEGQIATFAYRQGAKPITHRVIKVGHDMSGWNPEYTTAGDRDGKPDTTPVSPSMVLGTYAGHVPYLGLVSLLAGNPAVIAFFALTLIGLYYLSQNHKPTRKEESTPWPDSNSELQSSH